MGYISELRKYIGTIPIIAPGSAVIVMNDQGEILLQLRTDTNDWGLPGGSCELGETFEETAARELFEETGLLAERYELLFLASGREYYYKFPHGDEIYNATAVFKAIHASGKLRIDEESMALSYFSFHSLPILNATTRKLLEGIGYI